MADEDVRIDITLEDLKAEKALKGLRQESSRTFKQFEKDSRRGERSTRRLNKAFAGLGRQMTGLLAGFGAVQLGRTAVSNFMAQEKAVMSLEGALIASGQAWAGAREEMEEYAASLQQVTIHGDEAIIQGMQLAVSMGASVEQAKELAEAATNLSVALNVPFDTAVRQLAQTLGGQARELGMKVRGIRDLSPQELMGGAAIQVVQQQFAGMAQQIAQTEQGKFFQALNKLGDDLEPIGKRIVQGLSVLAGGIAWVIDKLPSPSKIAADIQGSTDPTVVGLRTVAGWLGADYDNPLKGESVEDYARRMGFPTKYADENKDAIRRLRKMRDDERREHILEQRRIKSLEELNERLGKIGIDPLPVHLSMESIQEFASEITGKESALGQLVHDLRSPAEQYRMGKESIGSLFNLFSGLKSGTPFGIMADYPELDALLKERLDVLKEELWGDDKLLFDDPPEDSPLNQYAVSFADTLHTSTSDALVTAIKGRPMQAAEDFARNLADSILRNVTDALAEAMLGEAGLDAEGISKFLGSIGLNSEPAI